MNDPDNSESASSRSHRAVRNITASIKASAASADCARSRFTRSTSERGSKVTSGGGGTKRASISKRVRVDGKISRHHVPHRFSVRAGTPWELEFERKFTDRPALVARYRRSLEGFARFLMERGDSLPDGARLPFRFVAYGDSRLAAWYEAILASYGDNDDHLAVVQSIATYAPNFLLHLGDFAQNGNDLEAVRNFFKVEKDFLISNPVVATYGNHEFQGKSSATTSDTYFDSYLVPTPGAPDFSYYAYNYGNIHFLVISTGQYSDADESYSNLLPGTSQYNFIQSDLSAAAANPNISHIMGELVQDTRRLAQNGQPRRERLLAIEIFHSWSGPFGHCHVCCQQGPWSFGQAR